MSSPPSFIPADLLYAAIVDSSDDAIISKNLASIVMSWNGAAQRMFGYSAAEMIGKSITILLPPDRTDEETAILAQLQRGQRVDHFETKRQRKDGRIIDVSLTISPIRNAEGIVVGASKIARDVTAQKEAHRRLAEVNEELSRANRIKGDFLTTLSHELRTPLNAILGWSQILKDGARPQDVAEAIAIIERNARAQGQLIEDLLDMSRIESGKLHLDIQRIDLSEVVSAGIETARPAADAKDIRLTHAFSSMTGTIMGDRDRIQQIVWNLLTNAVKFTPKHGRVHVVIKCVNSHVEICVTDTGEGIAPEFLSSLFERFRQADPSTTRRHGGLGLGLSIVRHLAELHGGSVHAASKGTGQGATFTVSLPLQAVQLPGSGSGLEESRNAQVDEAVAKADLREIRVLVVDDEAESVAMIKRVLERNGAEVRGAHSMKEALEVFSQFTPHVLLSDIGMPEHDGYELITRLRALPEGKRVPAVALTALARADDRTRALRAGFQMHVAKPVDFAELVAVVQNLASLQRPAKK